MELRASDTIAPSPAGLSISEAHAFHVLLNATQYTDFLIRAPTGSFFFVDKSSDCQPLIVTHCS